MLFRSGGRGRETESCRCEGCVASASSILEMYGYDPAEMDMHRQAVCDECGERIPDDDAAWHYHPGAVMGAGGHDDMPDDREAYYNERAERMP